MDMRIANLSFSTRKRKKHDEETNKATPWFRRVEPSYLCLNTDPRNQPEPKEIIAALGNESADTDNLPSNEELIERFIKPLCRADLVLQADWNREVNEVRSSMVEDFDEQYLYLAQTSPPILPSMKGIEIEITFLDYFRSVGEGAWLRAGYHAELLDVAKQTRSGGFGDDFVLVFDLPKKLTTASTRMSHRITPTRDMVLSLRVLPYLHQPLRISDISLGGLSFYHHSSLELPPGMEVRLRLLSGLTAIYLAASITSSKPAGPSQRYAAAKFQDLDPDERDKLHILLNQMARHILALRSGVKTTPS
jgi:hypothetical protein